MRSLVRYTRSRYRLILLSILVIGGLLIVGRYHYLLFHSLVEGFSILIAFGIFVIAWNSRSMLENDYLLFVGIAYLFVGGLDFLHTLAYQGMGVFPHHGSNLATQLWIAARYMESLSLLIAPLFLNRRLRNEMVIAGYTLLTAILILAIFRWNLFPDCFIEGVGLTPFKKISEYAISGIFLFSAVLLILKGKVFDPDIQALLIASMLVSMGAELFFTLYTDVYGLFNQTGHLLQIISYYLIYRALIVTGISRPHAVLFRDLQQNEAFLNSVVKSSLSGLYIYDMESGINTFINPQYTRLTGYTLKAIQEMSETAFFNLFHPQDQEKVAAHLERLKSATDREIHEIEYRFKTKDGRWIWCISRDAIFKRGEDGSVLQFMGSFLDITERRNMEDELRRTRDELEVSVQERTAELRWRNRELREFAYVASHDLQEPLRKIQTFGELLQNEAGETLSERAKDYLKRMRNAARRMQALVQSLLAYSRLSTGVSPYTSAELNEIVQKALDNLELKIEETGASITVEKLPRIETDPIQMIQLFQNLIGNALRFHHQNQTPWIRIESTSPLGSDTASSQYCEIRVQDNGIGFEEKYVDQIFRPFERLHGRHEYEGTGMGLAICQRIVERHGGRITAKSKPGKGTTFLITLPFVQKKETG
ncbi:MAG: MASE3 domain-containing protein [Deltaproteobacteria bacterium]